MTGLFIIVYGVPSRLERSTTSMSSRTRGRKVAGFRRRSIAPHASTRAPRRRFRAWVRIWPWTPPRTGIVRVVVAASAASADASRLAREARELDLRGFRDPRELDLRGF